MGRPVNKRWFGNPSLAGSQLRLSSAWIPGDTGASSGTIYIVKQVGTGRYKVTNGTYTGVVRLVAGTETLASGLGKMVVSPYGGGTEYARVIYNRTVKTWSLNRYKWQAGVSPTAAGEASLPTG